MLVLIVFIALLTAGSIGFRVGFRIGAERGEIAAIRARAIRDIENQLRNQ